MLAWKGVGGLPTPWPDHSRLPAGWWKDSAPPRCTTALAKPGGVSHRTADRLVAAARAQLIRGWDVQRHEMFALLLARLDTVFREAMAAKNHGAALGAINSAAKLTQL